jgi:chorismate mutase
MTLGDEIRSIADRIKQETEVQIKATSRILGAAAQISENHERLINEVVEMLEEDIDQQNKMSKNSIYSVDALKQQFKTFNKAKSYFNLKVKSWEALANKLNDLSFQKSMSENESKSERDSSSKSMEEIELGQKEIKNIIVCLQPDVAEIFPNESAVNEALRFLIRITSKNLC